MEEYKTSALEMFYLPQISDVVVELGPLLCLLLRC